MSVQLSGPLIDSINDTTRLVVTSHRPVSSRADVRDALEGRLPQIIDAVGFPLSSIVDASVRGSTRVDLTVPTEIGRRTPDSLQMSATGIYPLTIDVERSGERIIRLVSFIERLGPDTFSPVGTDPLSLALVGRLAPPISLDAEAEEAEVDMSESNRVLMSDWVALLENRPGFLATIAVQPEFLDSFGRSTPEDRELLIRLQRATVFDAMSTTYVAMDPTDADRHALNEVFTRQLRLGETTLSSLFPTRITPRRSWVSTSPLSSEGARFLADLGFRNAVLAPAAHEFDGLDPTRLVELSFSDDGTIFGVIADDRLAAALETGSSRPVGGEHLVAHQILADLKTMILEMDARDIDPSRSALVLTTETGDVPSARMSAALWDVVNRDPRFTFTSLNEAVTKMFGDGDLERVELETFLDQPTAFPASTTLNATMQSLQSTIDAFASILPRGDDKVRGWRRILDALADNRLSSQTRQSYTEAIRFATQEIASSVVPPASTTFTLGGRDSPIRFSVRNDSTSNLEVLIRLTSPKLRLSESDKVVALPAGTSTAVEFAVSARSNGRFPVTLELLTPDGEVLLGPPSTLTARVNALSGLGQLVTGIALLFLASWWANHFRRQYRRRQSEASLSSRRHPSGESQNRDNTRS